MNESHHGLVIHNNGPPLRLDEGGAVRVVGTRVSLDLIVEQYENGMTPEEIVGAYDTLDLADVYAVIAYFLRHQDEVQTWLNRRGDKSEALQSKIVGGSRRITRAELEARQSALETADASIGQ